MLEPETVNSDITWLPVLIDGAVFGKNIAFKKSVTLPDVPALKDALNNPDKLSLDTILLPS